jgi:hypothetical protein
MARVGGPLAHLNVAYRPLARLNAIEKIAHVLEEAFVGIL